MRCALGQIDTTQGEPALNRRLIVDCARRAAAAGASLLVLPELALPGYCPKDLCYHESFLGRVEREARELARELPANLLVLFGSLARPPVPAGRRRHNVALMARDGELRVVATKRFLPNYDVFDERRWFDAGDSAILIEHEGLTIGVTVCEDIWNGTAGDPGMPRYEGDPPAELVAAGADLVVNLSASPWHRGKGEGREALVGEIAARVGRPLLLCNLVGGDDDVVFDGNSVAANGRGEIIARAEAFAEDLVVFDLDAQALPARRPDGLPEIRRAIVLGIRDYFAKSGFERALLGLSGGIDSALVAVLAAEALGPERVIGVGMPSRYSADASLDDARALAKNLGIEFRVMPIEGVFGAVTRELGPQFDGRELGLTLENVQPRIRGLFLMALANELQGLVLATGNKSELAMGYCTLYGDMCGALAPIADLLKTEVYALARHLNEGGSPPIPERSLARAPSAELRFDQKDSDSLPEYEILDPILRAVIEDGLGLDQLQGRGFEAAVARDVLRRVALNEHKRKQMPPGIKLSCRAFGSGRRMPITGGRLDRYDDEETP
ncbi:MAG: NAD+ synthase [Planctomycetes bacterium]|nr:NAD+ synthase [Planctomycetota bacterium]